MTRSLAALIALLALSAGATSSAAPPASTQDATQSPPAFRTGVEAVSVDVTVLDDDGQPVKDLGPSDFTVTVAGRPRRVVSASFVDVSHGRPAAASVPIGLPVSSNDAGSFGRLIVFVVDQGTLDQSEVRQVADAASRLLDRLTPADRSALVLMPVGKGLSFTADHARVREGLRRASGLAGLSFESRVAGLDEIRSIASGDYRTLQNVASRECGPGSEQGSGFAQGSGGAGTPGSGLPGQQGGGQAGGVRGGAGGTSGEALLSADSCTRRVQSEVLSLWHQVHGAALSSLTSMRAVLKELKSVPGDKSLVLISGGWPLEMRESSSELVPLAEVAADARVTIFTLFAASAAGGADRSTISTTPLADQSVRRGPLQTISGMTGGASYRADIGPGAVFDRLARELSAFYRLGVEQESTDLDGKARPLKIQVTRRGATVRTRDRFAGLSYEERDAPARLDAALTAPLPSTAIGLRVATYLSVDPNASHMRVLLAGEATRLQPGAVTLQLALADASGNALSSADQPLGTATSDRLPFSTSVSLAPGRYVIRVAVVDGSGAVGSVDHPIEVQPRSIGPLSSGDLVLARVPGQGSEDTGLVIDGLGQDERLAMQIDLAGDRDRAAAADVVFEIAQSDEGPPLLTVEATRLSGSGAALAQAVADTRLLPPGTYVARARIASGEGVAGVVRRPFIVTGAPAGVDAPADVAGGGATAGRAPFVRNSVPISTRVSASLPPFSREHVLAPPVLGTFVDRVSARPDAASPSVGPLLARVKATGAADIAVPDAVTTEAPAVAQFLVGVSRLARNQLDPAAQAFRASLRASPDFYPAMVYLGACFAAGGKDLEASAAWQTALIKEGDVPAVHELLVDALLRLKRNDAALEAVRRARQRFPDDPSFTRRFVVTAVAAGRYAEGLTALDGLPPASLEDEPAYLLGLQVLYESITGAQPVETLEADRARMRRYAEAYERLHGPSAALVRTWVAAAAPPP